MAVFFENVADVTNPATYKAKLKTALTKIGSTRDRFTYFDQFTFDNGPRAALIPGKLDPAVAKDLAKKGQKPAQGFCTFAHDTGLELVVTKGVVEEGKLQKSLKHAGLECAVTISAGVDSGTDEELAKLSEAGAVSKGKAAFGEELAAHVAGKTSDDREAHARTALQMGETAANLGKGPDDKQAHSLAAHGPGVDQTTRVVAGYRADEVDDLRADGNLPADVVLTTPDGAGKAMPGFTKVGQEASNVSSAFGSATAMLAAITEALAQVAQIESFIAKELKHVTDDKRVLGVPAVRDALAEVVALRREIDPIKARIDPAKAARAGGAAVRKELDEVARLSAKLDEATKAFVDAKKAAMAQLPTGAPSEMQDKRFVPTVEPGMTTGTSYTTSEPALEKGADLTQATMQKRLDGMQPPTEGLTKATVVLDPAYVERPDGSKARAGWQAQTAFPTTEGTPTGAVTQGEYVVLRMKERLAKAETLVKAADEKRTELKKQETDGLATRKAAELALEKAEQPITETPIGQDPPADITAAFKKAQADVQAAKAALAETRAQIAKVEETLRIARTSQKDAEKKVTEAEKATLATV